MKERMTGTTKKKARSNRLLVGVLVCSLLASCILGFSQAKAADPIDLSNDVSFTFGFSSKEQADDLGNDNVVVDLYKIANAVKVPKYDTYEFQFETGSVYEGKVDLTKTDDKGDPDWAAISAQAAEVALASGTPVLTGGAVNNPRETVADSFNHFRSVSLQLVSPPQQLGSFRPNSYNYSPRSDSRISNRIHTSRNP